jgi:glyoxylase-like metal-dependent hydrolase (beta-lactamase superfamily II)
MRSRWSKLFACPRPDFCFRPAPDKGAFLTFAAVFGTSFIMPEGSHRFQAGSITCTVLADGYCSYPTPWFFPNADPGRLMRALEERRQPLESVLSPYACMLIQTGRRVMLVDAGAGESSATSGAILARLEMEGVRPKDVDTVILTHAHPDHIGGAVDLRGRPAFPNARHVLSEMEFEFWSGTQAGLRNLALPEEVGKSMAATARHCLHALRFQLETVTPEAEIAPGVRLLAAPGHTPGHLAVLIASDGRKLLNVGDAATHPLHLEHPEWENGFDLDGPRAMATRRELLGRAAAEDMRVMAFHFPFPSVGRIAARPEGGWVWSPGW